MNPLFELKFMKFHDLLRIQAVAIMGGCTYVILPLESLESCVDGGVLEPLVMLVQHTFGSLGYNQSIGQLVEQST